VRFTFPGGAGGELAESGVVRDRVGNLYGTTEGGGASGPGCGGTGCGVLYKLDPSGNETVLRTPGAGAVALGPDGNLYGNGGGGTGGGGVIFKLTLR
jgi:hypothetical protein